MEIEDIKRIISQALEKYPKAKRIAVENFLATSRYYDYTTQLMNLKLDAKLYGWNADTVKAIRLGLKLMFQK
jgi:ABC-type lipoprotein release transport system permease subunit